MRIIDDLPRIGQKQKTLIIRPHSTMDSVRASEAWDVGSIPTGGINIKGLWETLYIYCPHQSRTSAKGGVFDGEAERSRPDLPS